MILAIDIGNTNLEIGILPDKDNNFEIIASVRYYTQLNITSDQMGFFILDFLKNFNIEKNKIKRLIFSSVVPPLNNIIKDMFLKYFNSNILEINGKINIGIKNCYKKPSEVGSDRLVNAAAAFHIYKKNCIIVDIGTATTICAVTKKGEYLGGAIFPGIRTATNALTSKAARLPMIKIRKKNKLLSNNTAGAIESGVFFSYYYSIKGMVNKLSEEVNFSEYITLGTGGFINIFKTKKIIDVIDPLLTLKGLKIINDLNKKK